MLSKVFNSTPFQSFLYVLRFCSFAFNFATIFLLPIPINLYLNWSSNSALLSNSSSVIVAISKMSINSSTTPSKCLVFIFFITYSSILSHLYVFLTNINLLTGLLKYLHPSNFSTFNFSSQSSVLFIHSLNILFSSFANG